MTRCRQTRSAFPGILRAAALLLAAGATLAAEPLRFSAAEATFHRGDEAEFLKVIDGVPEGPSGWSPALKAYEAHALVVRCERPVEAAELDVDLFFLAGRPLNPLAEFSLAFTTDAEPSLQGNWQPLEITRFGADVNTLRRTPEGSLRVDLYPYIVTGSRPDDVYRLRARLPGGRATGFRLNAIPVQLPGLETRALSWWPPHDFTLTEFRVAVHVRETTNIALYQPVTASHELFIDYVLRQQQQATNLTDGLPATIAHPKDPDHGSAFFFEIDLGRVADFDHINLRNRADQEFERMSRLRLKWFEQPPAEGGLPTWETFHRADGSHPAPGAVDLLRAGDGRGKFRGRYLRISSESSVPISPQLAEVEVYETRTPVLVSVLADGKPLEGRESLTVPPGTRRLAVELQIPQPGKPVGDVFRWRLTGDVDAWQRSSRMTLDMACPPPGRSVFEAQALHSDREWDATVLRMPILVRQHFWMSAWFQWSSGLALAGLATGSGIFLSRRRAARQLARMKAEAALSIERARIARDMHDEVGGKLARLSLLGDLVLHGQDTTVPASPQLNALTRGVREVAVELEQVIWSLSPQHDSLEDLVRHIYQYAEEFFADTPVSCRFGPMAAIPPGIKLRPEPRNALFRSFKEAVANVLKHARAGTAEIDVRYEDGLVEIRVVDHGRGFDPAGPPSATNRHGLANMRERMHSIGGTCSIHSGPEGTIIVLRWEHGARGA